MLSGIQNQEREIENAVLYMTTPAHGSPGSPTSRLSKRPIVAMATSNTHTHTHTHTHTDRKFWNHVALEAREDASPMEGYAVRTHNDA